MLRDVGGSLWGAVVFALALVTPGYCVGQAIDVCGFRGRGLREQMAWSVALSMGAFTLPLVGVVWLAGVWAGAAVLVVCGVGALALWLRRKPGNDFSRRERTLLPPVALLWALVVVFSLVDVGFGSRLWMSVTVYDHSVRTAFVDAVMRTGVVPANPLYWPGHAAPMRYYYFWYVTCGVVAKLAHISARQALMASCVWPMFGVVAMLALFGKYLLGWRGEQLRRSVWLGAALLAVTGLDGLVALFTWLVGQPTTDDMEWWSVDQVTSWLDSFLWVPHHVAALVCCLLCLLLLFLAVKEPRPRTRWRLAVVAGLSFASGFGLSTYVALATCLIAAVWLAVGLLRGVRRLEFLAAIGLAAFTAAVVLTPYVAQLMRHEASGGQPAAQALGFGIRRIIDVDVLGGLNLWASWRSLHPVAAMNVSAGILLLPGYAVELGFFGVVLVVAQRRLRGEGERTLLLWTWSGLAAASLLRSQVIVTNDYAIRASLLFQFFLLLLGAVVLAASAGWLRKTLLVLVAVGVSGTVYQLVLLRTYLPWHEAHGEPEMKELAGRSYALREAYSAAALVLPEQARLQYSVGQGRYVLRPHLLDAGRQLITSEHDCETSFGGESAACASIQQAVAELFPAAGQNAPDAMGAQLLCERIGADYLVATSWDEAWRDRQSWVWQLSSVVKTTKVRVLACSVRASSLK